METQPPPAKARHGTPGLDIFKIAGQSISGFLPSFKTGSPDRARQPFTSQLEERLAMFLEYHPHVQSYQRGDASEAFARARHLHTPLGTPYRIGYMYEGQPHDYLPDFVGTLCDGGLLIAEAGREEIKSQGQAVAKAEAARRVAHAQGGVYWIGTDQNLNLHRHYNWMFLHARRQSFVTYDEIAAVLLAHWPWGEQVNVNDWVRQFGSRWSDQEVEAAVWKLVAEAAARGHLLVDVTEVKLSRSTPMGPLGGLICVQERLDPFVALLPGWPKVYTCLQAEQAHILLLYARQTHEPLRWNKDIALLEIALLHELCPDQAERGVLCLDAMLVRDGDIYADYLVQQLRAVIETAFPYM